jgi:hypothetical protein
VNARTSGCASRKSATVMFATDGGRSKISAIVRSAATRTRSLEGNNCSTYFAASSWSRVDADGYLEKRLVLDLLHIRDPDGISLPARPGEFGIGDPFSFPLQSVESLEVLGGERLLAANDNNYPSSDGRWIARDRPDDTELIVVRAPTLR